MPLEEELFFRGIVFGLLVRPAGTNVALALILSSAVFAIEHAYQGPRGMARSLVLGALLAGLYLTWGSLWVPILVHVANNAVAMLVKRAAMRRARDTGDRPLPMWPSDSVTADLIAAYASVRTGVPDHGPIRRCLKTAIVVDLIRWGAISQDQNRFRRRLSTSGSPQADIQLRSLDSQPLTKLGATRLTDPVVEFVAREMVEAGRLDYSPLNLERLRYRPTDPHRVEGLLGSVRAKVAGQPIVTDDTGAAFGYLAIEAGLVPIDPRATVPIDTIRTNLLAGSGQYRALLEITAAQAPAPLARSGRP